MQGYWRNPEATASAFLGDGWLRTGDIARQDGEGRVFIVDRGKELIKAYGRQVAPAELEAILLSHPAVAEAAVVPTPSIDAGESPKAFVVLRPGAQVAPEELMILVAARVASFKWIEDVEFVPALPIGPGGKVLRRVLAESERQRAAARGAVS
jgi:acyl-CoA synthetase (AMP-forming)/AMP-acid ligase II